MGQKGFSAVGSLFSDRLLVIVTSIRPSLTITVVLWLSFRDAVNTSVYALAKTSLFSTALKDNHNTTVSDNKFENTLLNREMI